MPLRLPLILALAIAVIGCGVHDVSLPGFPSAAELQAESREEARQRERYQATSDPKALRWLLANRVRQGMSLAKINNILGRDGKRIYDDARYKKHAEGVRRTDDTYKWVGDDGNTYLYFRNDRLVVFDPTQYAESETASFERR